jgi:hypothetical protein
MRYTLTGEVSAGWTVLDGLSMRARYFDGTEEEANAYVEALNVIETIRLRKAREEADARRMLERLAA